MLFRSLAQQTQPLSIHRTPKEVEQGMAFGLEVDEGAGMSRDGGAMEVGRVAVPKRTRRRTAVKRNVGVGEGREEAWGGGGC